MTSLEGYDGSNSIILRHDVDFDLAAAHKLAKLETKLKVKSTFFVMATSYTYNPLAQPNRHYLKSIAEMGFEIGLHFYPKAYGVESARLMERRVDEESEVLESVTGERVKSVSIHNPSISNSYPLFKKYRNAYDPKIFSESNYISDSLMMFRKDIYSFVERASETTIQILLHPLYYTPRGDGMDAIFYRFVRDYLRQVDEIYKVNKTYTSSVKPDLLTYIVNRAGEKGR